MSSKINNEINEKDFNSNVKAINEALLSYMKQCKRTDKQVKEYGLNLFKWYYPNANEEALFQFSFNCVFLKGCYDVCKKTFNALQGVKNEKK